MIILASRLGRDRAGFPLMKHEGHGDDTREALDLLDPINDLHGRRRFNGRNQLSR